MHSDGDANHPYLHKMKARIEIVGDFEYLKKIITILRSLTPEH